MTHHFEKKKKFKNCNIYGIACTLNISYHFS